MTNFISNETIDAILDSPDLISIIGEYTRLEQRSPNDWWGCCPFHGEKTPSFHVDANQKFYYCFGCHKGGNIISFVMEMEKLPYSDALISIAKKMGIPIKYKNGENNNSDFHKKNDELEKYIDLYERTASMFHYFLLETQQGKKALDYVLKRGLSIDIIKKFKIGYAPDDRKWLKDFLKKKNFSNDFLNKSGLFSQKYPDYSFFSDRLMFPIFNRRGQVVAFGGRVIPPADESQRKYLNSPDLPQFKKRETLFGFNFAKNSIRQNKKIIFCEGNMDVIAYHQCGLDFAVATLGTAMTVEHIKMIQGFVAEGTVYLSFDSDGAGQTATWKAIKLCRENDLTVRIIRLKGGKDPSEILLKFGEKNLTSQVNNAILDCDYLLLRLGEKYPVDTPEGKTKAALEFFQYVDVLKSDIQRESCLEQLCQTFNLKPEAVKRDFINRNRAQERSNIRNNTNQIEQNTPVKLDAELRGLIAVTADPGQFKNIRSKISENDLQNIYARRLFKILEECYIEKENSFTIKDILDCLNQNEDDKKLVQVITESISSGVYQSERIGVFVQDTIEYILKNRLEDQRNKLSKRIKEYSNSIATEDDQIQFNNLLKEKLELDKKIQALVKK